MQKIREKKQREEKVSIKGRLKGGVKERLLREGWRERKGEVEMRRNKKGDTGEIILAWQKILSTIQIFTSSLDKPLIQVLLFCVHQTILCVRKRGSISPEREEYGQTLGTLIFRITVGVLSCVHHLL